MQMEVRESVVVISGDWLSGEHYAGGHSSVAAAVVEELCVCVVEVADRVA